MAKLKIAVLISGRGSNLRALIQAATHPDYPAEIALVLSNKSSAKGLDHAKAAGLETRIIAHRDFADRESFDAAIDDAVRAAGAELICLAGFMRLLTAGFVSRWRDRMINIHPSLLPAFKGLDTHERALDAGVKFAGCTLHYVRPEMDDGPIIAQAVVPVAPEDTPETLAARILEEENALYPRVVRWIAEGRVRVRAERVLIDQAPPPLLALSNPLDSL